MTRPLTSDQAGAAPDAALLVAYGNGDRAAGRELVARLGPRALGYATRMLGDRAEAEDVVQEAMLRLWKQAPAWRQGEAQVGTWLYRVVSNLCIDRIRARRPGPPLDQVPDPADATPAAVDRLADRDRAQALETALLALPERQRQAVVLRHLEGLSNSEIAEVMDINVAAVESLTARGKRALARALSGRREELGYG
ncbi:RNA polymerase sigma factor [Rhodobacteraceae bacterium CCMM004]|nr:RNA polymerase sigma factor [Rhodobacteraceae bacterium CCMM004]